ncbi:DUF2163 domain-containing protein [Castellaniella sp.]|uniref:DUF2163 domain-containing protein n=1 Tax=Castellaniella sp. TaxID=1955812 RepID=UPI00355F7066
MKTVDARISAHVRSQVTTLCTCWELVRTDGQRFTWTDHDTDVLLGGDVYRSAADGGFDRSAVEATLSLDVTNSELLGFIGDGLDADELRAGLFDGATIRMMLVNWADPGMGAIVVRYGTLGEVSLADGDLFRVEVRGLQQAYKQIVGEVYSPDCRANFGDARCGIDITQHMATMTVLQASSRAQFTVAEGNPTSMIDAPEGMLNFGVVRFITGANIGRALEIKEVDGDMVRLKFAAANIIEPGDELEMISGCDQRYSTCAAYGNIINFRGEPFVPGENTVFRIVGR